MNALPKPGLIFVFLVTQAIFTRCISINKLTDPLIIAKTRIELPPLTIPSFLNDVIRISAPMINEESEYYLHKPSGDVMKLDLPSPKLRKLTYDRDIQPIVARFTNNIKPMISQSNNYDVFSVEKTDLAKEVFDTKVEAMDANDFMIGPLLSEDNGNWVLSLYTKDFNDDWIELFKVITVTITDFVPLTPWDPTLNIGDIFNLSFVYPITNLESCELVAPRSTFDRFYDRSRIDMNNCGFTVPNITEQDMGMWKIIAVGKIVYEGEVMLNVNAANNTMNTTTIANYV